MVTNCDHQKLPDHAVTLWPWQIHSACCSIQSSMVNHTHAMPISAIYRLLTPIADGMTRPDWLSFIPLLLSRKISLGTFLGSTPPPQEPGDIPGLYLSSRKSLGTFLGSSPSPQEPGNIPGLYPPPPQEPGDRASCLLLSYDCNCVNWLVGFKSDLTKNAQKMLEVCSEEMRKVYIVCIYSSLHG